MVHSDDASKVFGVDITEKDPADAVNNAAEMMDAAFAAAVVLTSIAIICK